MFRKLILVLAITLAGCYTPPIAVEQRCLPPEPVPCAAGRSSAVAFDSSMRIPGSWHYFIQHRTAPLNSPGSDFANVRMRIQNGEGEIATSDRDGVQALYFGRVSNPAMERMDVTAGDHAGTAALVSRNNQIIFSRPGPTRDPNDYDLFEASYKQTGDAFSVGDEVRLDEVSRAYSFDSHAATSADGLTLYFVSDRPGGLGGTDIWHSTRRSINDKWSAPKPVDKVNTPCDELSPRLYESSEGDTLYFASTGFETHGGYDIFKTAIVNGTPQQVANVGTPINTRSDEVFPLRYDPVHFSYSSDQVGGLGKFDVYVVEREKVPERTPVRVEPPIKVDTPRPIQTVTIAATVTRGSEAYPAKDAEIFVRDAEKQLEVMRTPVDDKGKLGFELKAGKEYDVGAESAESFYDVKRLDLREPRDSNISISFNLPDTLVLRINFPFDDYEHPYEFIIGDQGEKLPMNWQNSLDLVAQSIKGSSKKLHKIIIIGHTDSMGTDDYNTKLGFRRATFISNELVKRGTDRALIAVESRGRVQPPPHLNPIESDEIFRLRSRRVEFIKVFK